MSLSTANVVSALNHYYNLSKEQQIELAPVKARLGEKCSACGLKIRGVLHNEGQHHIRRKASVTK